MPYPVLARAYIVPAKNKRVATTPGRDVVFYGGQATIVDARDMPIILQREDVTVEVPANKMDWLPGWLNACPEQHPPRARLCFPEGYRLDHDPERGFFLAEHPPFQTEEGVLTEAPVGWMFPPEQ